MVIMLTGLKRMGTRLSWNSGQEFFEKPINLPFPGMFTLGLRKRSSNLCYYTRYISSASFPLSRHNFHLLSRQSSYSQSIPAHEDMRHDRLLNQECLLTRTPVLSPREHRVTTLQVYTSPPA
jgi:hypothetical protein